MHSIKHDMDTQYKILDVKYPFQEYQFVINDFHENKVSPIF